MMGECPVEQWVSAAFWIQGSRVRSPSTSIFFSFLKFFFFVFVYLTIYYGDVGMLYIFSGKQSTFKKGTKLNNYVYSFPKMITSRGGGSNPAQGFFIKKSSVECKFLCQI